jgi:hypothetical protein
VDEFPANFLIFFSRANSDSTKTSKKAMDREQTKAPFPPIAIFTILATSWHNARNVAPRAYFTCKNAPGSIY